MHIGKRIARNSKHTYIYKNIHTVKVNIKKIFSSINFQTQFDGLICIVVQRKNIYLERKTIEKVT